MKVVKSKQDTQKHVMGLVNRKVKLAKKGSIAKEQTTAKTQSSKKDEKK